MDDIFLFIVLIACGFLGWFLRGMLIENMSGFKLIKKAMNYTIWECKNCGNQEKHERKVIEEL